MYEEEPYIDTRPKIKPAPKAAVIGLFLGIAAIVLSYFGGGILFGIPGVIFSSVALKICIQKHLPHKGKAITGIVLSTLSIFISFISLFMISILSPSLVRNGRKANLTDDVRTGVYIAESARTALTYEAPYQAAKAYDGQILNVNDILAGNDDFCAAVRENLGKDSVEGSTTKDLGGLELDQNYYMQIDLTTDQVTVWYGKTDNGHQCYPESGFYLIQQ